MIRITFFHNRIDIESPGFLLPGMTVQDIRSGVSRISNPVIAQIFRELHLTEQWGSGVKRIFAEAAAQGLPQQQGTQGQQDQSRAGEPRVVEIATGVRLSAFLATLHDADATAAANLSLAHCSEQVGA